MSGSSLASGFQNQNTFINSNSNNNSNSNINNNNNGSHSNNNNNISEDPNSSDNVKPVSIFSNDYKKYLNLF